MRDALIEFMDSIREYVRESGTNLAHDERESSEFVDIYLKNKQLLSIHRNTINHEYGYELSIDGIIHKK